MVVCSRYQPSNVLSRCVVWSRAQWWDDSHDIKDCVWSVNQEKTWSSLLYYHVSSRRVSQPRPLLTKQRDQYMVFPFICGGKSVSEGYDQLYPRKSFMMCSIRFVSSCSQLIWFWYFCMPPTIPHKRLPKLVNHRLQPVTIQRTRLRNRFVFV